MKSTIELRAFLHPHHRDQFDLAVFLLGREPDLVARRNVPQGPVEVADAVWHADQVRVQRDPHYPAIPRAFLTQDVESLANAVLEFLDAALGMWKSGMSLTSIE